MSHPRILVVHNRYQLPGGEDAVVEAEIELLRRNGHAVETYLRDNRDLTAMKAVEAFAHTLWSRRTWNDIARLTARFRPDVIHAHNTFALVSSSLYWAADRLGIPVVQTLHNFRLLCVQAMFLHDGRVCEDCLGHLPWRGVTRRCYRESGLQSAALAATLSVHRSLGTYRDKVARYIALTEFCREKFIAGGLPASRVAVKPNFADIGRPDHSPRHGGLYVGRLAAEKGIDILMHALRELPSVSMDVIGDGPERDKVAAHPQLRLLGWLGSAEVYERMRAAAYLVMPSRWYENFPRTLIEAYANGLPLVASDLGALAELVDHGRTGLLFKPGAAHDLARHIAWAEAFPAKMRLMGENARATYEARFTADRNYAQLMAIYEDAMAAARLKVAV
ncbi:MAG: glycosyltransferase family 4 protein [Betaproteobacteria bacterium]|nr:glycosyltransferase family 4 protein [Betaproteobacteria bacterium]